MTSVKHLLVFTLLGYEQLLSIMGLVAFVLLCSLFAIGRVHSTAFNVTLSVFSGRVDPFWIVSNTSDKKMYKALETALHEFKAVKLVSILGFRGFQAIGGPLSTETDIGNDKKTAKLQHLLLESGKKHLEAHFKGLYAYVKKQIAGALDDSRLLFESEMSSNEDGLFDSEADLYDSEDDFVGSEGNLGVCAAGCPQHYNPMRWNTPSRKRTSNNCYNYATNKMTYTFAQPGRSVHNGQYRSFACSDLLLASVHDHLKALPEVRNNQPIPHVAGDCTVALVSWPNNDFHWYRVDALENGRWSHKPGETHATNHDNGGATFNDPRTANRGPYTDFCRFMTSCSTEVTVN